jgi:hypothetical protein
MASDDTAPAVNAGGGVNKAPGSPQGGIEGKIVPTKAQGGPTEAPRAAVTASGSPGSKKAATRPRGRPQKARGGANTGDSGRDKWTIRGVALNIRRLASAEAEARNLTVGDWVSEAIAAYAKGKGGVPATSQTETVSDALGAVMRRLEAIEADRDRGLLARLFGRR